MRHPLLFKFTETTIFNAVILTSLISAIATFLSINLTLWFHDVIHLKNNENNNNEKNNNNALSGIAILLSLIVCFLSSIFAYYIIIILFGYGQSLIIN